MTKPSFGILTKIQLRNLNQTLAANTGQTSASKSRLNFSTSKSWPKHPKSEQKLSFITKPQLPNLQQTVADTILIINILNSNNLDKFWVGNFTRQGQSSLLNGSECVSEWVTWVSQWSDSGPIITFLSSFPTLDLSKWKSPLWQVRKCKHEKF